MFELKAVTYLLGRVQYAVEIRTGLDVTVGLYDRQEMLSCPVRSKYFFVQHTVEACLYSRCVFPRPVAHSSLHTPHQTCVR